jgi:hypothetical protein
MEKFMDFADALKHLKTSTHSGEKAVTISSWYDSQAKPVVKLQIPDEHSKMTEPYLYMEKNKSDGGKAVFPLDLSCESILSEDWTIVQ